MTEFTPLKEVTEAQRQVLDNFTMAYLHCAEFTDASTEDDGDLRDMPWSNEFIEQARRDCIKFQDENKEALEACYASTDKPRDETNAGHDFWLTRNGHGAGFWDGDWPEPWATALDEASRKYGEVDLYAGDDGFIYAI